MKKLTALILSIVMLVSSALITMAEENGITVYITFSKYGEFLTDINGSYVAMSPLYLSGQDSYVLNDALKNAHIELCESGESAYETATGDYGLYITKFWDDISGNFTYQLNFTEESVWGPTHEIEDGDCIELFINQSTYPDTEAYTKFDKSRMEILLEETADLTLLQGEYSGDGMAFSPCCDAVITVNGAETEIITDENGFASISFDEYGEYIISARKTKLVSEETVTAIEAPVCVVTVSEEHTSTEDFPADTPEDDPVNSNAEEQLHNIVGKYFNDNILSDGNMNWFVADFADYLKIYPESTAVFSDNLKQSILDKVIASADYSTSQSDLAKSIITLRALGYDAKNTYKKDGSAFDIVEKLLGLITEESVSEPYYEYTLPYVLIALEQGENYASSEKIDFLLNAAINSKAAWQDTSWGTDGAAPMLRALAPYSDTNKEIKALIEETAELIKAFQGSNGSMGNAASTGLAIAGLSAVGINPETVLKEEKNLLDGLMSSSNETFDGFLPEDNSFCTEQGLRGLMGWKLFELDKMIYDFKDYPQNIAKATPEVIHKPSGGGGGGGSSSKKNNAAEEVQGLSGKHKDIKILPVIHKDKTFEDIKNHPNMKAIEQLTQRGIINGKNEKNYCPDDTMTRAEFATITVNALGLPEKDGKKFNDINETDWFFKYINTAYNYGIINGVSETEFNPDGQITREEAATMVVRVAKLCGMNTELNETAIRNSLAEFSDYKKSSDWAMSALAFCYKEEILDKSVINIEPQAEITRAEIAQMLFNMLGKAKLL